MSRSLVALTLGAFLVVSSHAGAVSPIEKVIQMIGELEAKIIKEGEEAQKVYSEFAEWCEEQSKTLHFEIKTAKAEVEDLQAVIEKAKADIAVEDTKISELTGTIATDTADLKAATSIREKEFAEFSAEEKQLTETIDTLERAIAILEKELKSGASLLQLKNAKNVMEALRVLVDASAIGSSDASRLTSLLQSQQNNQDDMGMLGAPDPAVYESKSGGIVDALNDLLNDAETQLEEARKKESTSKNNFEMLKMELEDAIAFAQKELDKSKKRKAESEETAAVAEGDLAVTSKDLAEDMQMLADVHHDCMTKASDFELETTSRGEELKALAVAKKIIIEKCGGAADQTYSLVQESSFLQLTARRTGASTRSNEQGVEALRLVRQLAKKQKSAVLAQLAQRIAAATRFSSSNGEDPFAKIKGLISEMIEKLMKEAEEEAAKKAYCDKEMGETKTKKDDMTQEIDDLTAKIDQMTAESAKLKEEVAVLSKELADLAASQAEMDKVRKEENADYKKNKAEMDEGIEGIKLALKVLREYYAKADKGHDAAEGAGGGIIGMLEVAESDFTKGLEEMVAAEEAAAAEYEKTTKENELAKTTKEQDVKYKTKDSKALAKSAAELTSDREGVQTELDAVLEYYAKIKEECIAKPEPYEERKKRREAEIAGLKEALQILEGEAVLLQSGERKVTRHLRLVHSA